MTKSNTSLFVFLSSLLMAMPSFAIKAEAELSSQDVVNINPGKIRHVNAGVFSGGQPTQLELQKLKEKGIKTIVNLRHPSETDWDQKAVLSELGIKYINLPIRGASNINERNAQALMDLIDDHSKEPLLVHCGSGNRVGALISIANYSTNGGDLEQAIQEGRRWGLTGLESHTRTVIQEIQKTD